MGVVAGSLSCVDGTGLLQSPCGPMPPWSCVARPAPCAAPVALAPECVGQQWLCGDGAYPHQAVPSGTQCAPFFDGVAVTLGPALQAEARCGLMLDTDVTAGVAQALPQWGVLDPRQPFSACPANSPQAAPWRLAPPLSDTDIVDINAVLQTEVGQIVAHRLFARDLTQPFGVRGQGASVVAMRPSQIPAPRPAHSTTHGYRSLAQHGEWLYVFDCFGLPEQLIEDCGVQRVTVAQAGLPQAYAWLQRDGTWSARTGQRQVVFQAGPQHDVQFHPGLNRWLMLSVAGFGDTVFVRTAEHPAGPWSPARDVHRCELPDGDRAAFCDTVRLVLPLLDPLNPRQAVLTYRVDSIAPEPGAYASRMVWVDL